MGCNNISQVKWQDKHHVLAVEWDSVFEVTDEQIEPVSYTHLDVYKRQASIKDRPVDSRCELLTVIEGAHAGAKALYIDGRIRVAYGLSLIHI